MADQPDFDLTAGHRFFSAHCYNSTWELINKSTRTPVEDEQMLLRAFASLYHWTQRADCTTENRSIGLWQISRVYTLLKQPDSARRYAEQCRAESDAPGVPLFCLGFAYEALARTEMLAGNQAKMQEYLTLAQQVAARMTDEEDKNILLADLATIR